MFHICESAACFTDMPATECRKALCATQKIMWQIKQPLAALQLTAKLRKVNAEITLLNQPLLHKRKPSGTRIYYHSAFRFGMQLALLTFLVT
jgi:hypothetical protein